MDNAENFTVQFKDLAIQLGTEGIKYGINWLADWLIPMTHLQKSKDENQTFKATRTILVPSPSGTGTETFILNLDITKKGLELIMDKKDDEPHVTSHSFITGVSSEKYEAKKLNNELFNVSCTSGNDATSSVKGSFSFLNGIIGVTW